MAYRRDMLEIFAKNPQRIREGNSIKFPEISVKNGESIQILTNSTIELSSPGVYWVGVNTAAHTAGQEEKLGIQLFKNGSPVPYASSEATSTSETDTVAMAFTCLITVRPSCCAVDNTTFLTVDNIGKNSIYEKANITIFKIA